MSVRAAINDDPGIIPVYWFARFSDAAAAGDALMMSAARDRLQALGFSVGLRPAASRDVHRAPRPRRRRPSPATPSATER